MFMNIDTFTGKSFLLKFIIQELHDRFRPNQVGITASTGVAAARIGGQTIHSFTGVGLAKESAQELYSRLSNHSRTAWHNVTVLIVDEISMLDADLIDKLDYIGRKIKKQESLPFGGIQLIFCGDFYQLPPVSKCKGGKFAFESKSFVEFQNDDDTSMKLLELTQVVRQKDLETINLLNNARKGNLQQKDLAVLRKHNLRVEKSRERLTELVKDGIEPTKLYCKNINVNAENLAHLEKLPDEEHVLRCVDSDSWGGQPNSVRDRLQRQISELLPEELRLKVHAQVMCTKNMKDWGLVNGSRGVVTSFVKDEVLNLVVPMVKFDNGDEISMAFHNETVKSGEQEYRRSQVPLKLAWAVTIHKSQGMTLSRAILRLDDAFAYGQAYVALSRLSSFEGLFIEGKNIEISHVKADPEVAKYYETARRPILKNKASVNVSASAPISSKQRSESVSSSSSSSSKIDSTSSFSDNFSSDSLIQTPYEEMSLEEMKSIVANNEYLAGLCTGFKDDKNIYCQLLNWYEKKENKQNETHCDELTKAPANNVNIFETFAYQGYDEDSNKNFCAKV